MKYQFFRGSQCISKTVITLLISLKLSSFSMAQDNEIIFGTTQTINNLNPFTYTTYPAELIIQLTTERLIQKVCEGEGDREYRPVVQKTLMRGIQRDYNPLESMYFLNINSKSNIHMHDIAYTIKQINLSPMNRFHQYHLFFVSDIIKIENPRKARFSKAAMTLTFPIIKNNSLNYQAPISGKDHIQIYNNATTGIYKLDVFERNEIKLSARRPEQPAIPLTFKINNTNEQFIKKLLSKKIHVGLNVNGVLMNKLKGDYRFETTDDLNSFTYFGFNYNTENRRIKWLFSRNCEFRKAFAFAVGNASIVKKTLSQYGTTMRHTFDHMRIVDDRYTPPISYINCVPGKITRFVRALYQPEEITLRLLCSPNLIFPWNSLKALIHALNKIFFPANIHFRLLLMSYTSEFQHIKTNRDFEIIFDTFVFGQNKLRYIEFMNPENPMFNFLGCNTFSTHEIKKYKHKIEKRDGFLLKINRELPVFVLGRFPYYNAISKSITRPTSCGNTRAVPFTDIHLWKISSESSKKQSDK